MAKEVSKVPNNRLLVAIIVGFFIGVLIALFLRAPLTAKTAVEVNITNETLPALVCGNNITETGEECDGIDLNGQTCESLLGLDYIGSLACYANCTFDINGCTVETLGLGALCDPTNSADRAPNSGSGTVGEPYIITDCCELQGMADDLGAYYELANDINCSDTINWNSGAGFEPVGTSSTKFTGTFDGRDYTITGLFINRPSTGYYNYIGLFGRTDLPSEIKNVGLEDVDITGYRYVGSLVGVIDGEISNSYSTGNVSGYDQVGGLVGINNHDGEISNSYSTGSVTGSSYVGGLVGSNCGPISNSYSTGNVSGNKYVGGLVGYNYRPISNSFSTGSVTGSSYVGGLVGGNSGVISNSYWDISRSGKTNCVGYGSSSGCTGKNSGNSQPDYWYYSSHEPMNSWDFNYFGTWGIDEGFSYPYFGGAKTINGDGTSEIPYEINNCRELQSMTLRLGSYWWKLMNDIDCYDATHEGGSLWNSGAGFEPVGTSSSRFKGTFDGRNYTITGLFINRPSTDYVGLFGYADSSSEIKNVGLEDVDITGKSYAGGLVGCNYGPISNSYSTGSVSGSGHHVGGLVGENKGLISNSYSTGNVRGSYYVGGLVGNNYYGGEISNSYSTGNVRGSYYVGGLVGENKGPISNSFSTGSVSGSSNVGGLVGYNYDRGEISNSYSTGSVSGSSQYVGGLIGINNGGIFNSYSIGNVSGSNYVGGLVGYNSYREISNSYSTGSVNGNSNVGGLVGRNYGPISNSYSTGSVSGSSYVGGLVGHNYYGEISEISNSYSTGSVSGSSNVGGLVGCNSATIENSYFDLDNVTCNGGACPDVVTYGAPWAQMINSSWEGYDAWTVSVLNWTYSYWSWDEISYPLNMQPDWDFDGLTNAPFAEVDICPYDPYNDIDSDGACGDIDTCPWNSNPDQEDISACQPTVVIYEITQDGPPNLEVDAEINDPNADPLSGDIVIFIGGQEYVVLNDGNSYTDTIEPDVYMYQEGGWGGIIGNNLVFACGTCAEADFTNPYPSIGNCWMGGTGLCGYDWDIPRQIIDNDDKLCARNILTADKYDIDLLSKECGGCYDSSGWSGSAECVAAEGHTSYNRGSETVFVSDSYSNALPTSVNLAGMTPEENYTLKITTTDGFTPEARDEMEFLYQGENFMTFAPPCAGTDNDLDLYSTALEDIGEQCCGVGQLYTCLNGSPYVDCDDTDPSIYPGAEELCDGKDNDCDGEIDEGCPVHRRRKAKPTIEEVLPEEIPPEEVPPAQPAEEVFEPAVAEEVRPRFPWWWLLLPSVVLAALIWYLIWNIKKQQKKVK